MPNNKQNDETGLFEQKYADEAFIDAVETLGPLAAVGDISERVGCSHFTASERLKALAEEGRVEGEQRAGAVLWSLAEAGEQEDGEHA